MSKINILTLIYIAGIIFGALFLDIWASNTNLLKPIIAVAWTAIFLIALINIEKDK
jgi:hypothetical protein|tara:strand:- start:174 stop:341 length:168 start_codon:yes stop_codon:yes gene_type:complete